MTLSRSINEGYNINQFVKLVVPALKNVFGGQTDANDIPALDELIGGTTLTDWWNGSPVRKLELTELEVKKLRICSKPNYKIMLKVLEAREGAEV